MAEVSLKKAIQNLSRESADVFIGLVKSVSPLVIVPEHDEKLTLGAASLYLPRHLTSHSLKMNIPELGLEQVTAELQTGLVKGDRLYILSLAQSRKYLVIERV